jgi:hypothetical protein
MRGELCVGFASFLSFAAVMMLIFAHVGQINHSTVPRGISMVRLNVSGYGTALSAEFYPDPIVGLYTNDSSAPLGKQAGLRQLYEFGFYAHCAYIDDKHGICSNRSAAAKFRPYEAVVSDMTSQYSGYTDIFIPASTGFRADNSLGTTTQAAYWLILLGTFCAALALITGVLKHTVTFLASTILAIMSSLMLLIGAAIWTSALKRAESINSFELTLLSNNTSIPLGFTVSPGPGLYLVWASFAALLVSTVPYMLSCCTYRG